jgi:hypothetical protein
MLKVRTGQFSDQNAPGEPPTGRVGLNLQAYFRDLAMAEFGVPIQQAQAAADKFAEMVQSSEWLELSNGMATWQKKDIETQQPARKSPFPEWMTRNPGIGGDVSDAAPGL